MPSFSRGRQQKSVYGAITRDIGLDLNVLHAKGQLSIKIVFLAAKGLFLD